MSASNVEKFFEKVETDQSLAAKLKAAAKLTGASVKPNKERNAELATGVVQVAAAAGFKFTAKELLEANAAKRKNLPADALADVTGQGDDNYSQCDILMFRMTGMRG